jgi:hypothetical protein
MVLDACREVGIPSRHDRRRLRPRHRRQRARAREYRAEWQELSSHQLSSYQNGETSDSAPGCCS